MTRLKSHLLLLLWTKFIKHFKNCYFIFWKICAWILPLAMRTRIFMHKLCSFFFSISLFIFHTFKLHLTVMLYFVSFLWLLSMVYLNTISILIRWNNGVYHLSGGTEYLHILQWSNFVLWKFSVAKSGCICSISMSCSNSIIHLHLHSDNYNKTL